MRIQTVHRPRENLRTRRFPRAPRPREQVRMHDLSRHDLIFQRRHNGILPDHLIKGLWPIGAI